MTAYITIADSEIDPESPATTSLFTKLRNNPLSIQENDATAPDVVQALTIVNQGDLATLDKIGSGQITDYTAGDYVEGDVMFSSETELGDVGTSYVKKLEVKVARNGTVKVRIGIRESASGYNVVGKIYVNGAAQGTERNPTTTTNWQWWNQDISVSAGDLVQMYVHRGGSNAERASIAMAIMCDIPISSSGRYTFMRKLNRLDSTESIYDY